AEIERPRLLRAADAGTPAALRAMLAAHQVILLRGAQLDADAQAALAAGLGRPAADQPEGREAEPGWHMDLAWSAAPPRFCLLSARVPAGPGVRIAFASQVAAHDRLDPWLRERITFLDAEHRATEDGEAGAVHPLLRLDPETGRRSLLIGATARRIRGLPPEESDDLLHRLQAAATHPALVLRLELRDGDLLLWDNAAVQHRLGLAAGAELRLHRVAGHPPVGPQEVTLPWVSAG
uniref:TauD/TfdA dioxygenase family protein n=1 Tax=Falsiroseomonas oryziterrae TaxID=2911368 RepID=UPI001F3222AD